MSRHVEHWCRLRRVVDDDVVDIVVVYDVRDVAARAFCLSPLLRVPRGRTSAAHSEPLAVRRPCSFKSSVVFTLVRHRVFCQFLRTSERPLLVRPSVAADEVVILLATLGSLLGVVRAEDTTLAVSQVTLSSQFALGRGSGISLKVTFGNFDLLFVGFDFSNYRVRLVPQVVFVAAKRVPISILLILVEQVACGACC